MCFKKQYKSKESRLKKEMKLTLEINIKPREGGPRWWCRKILNSPPPTDTPDTQLHMDHFFLEEKKSENQINCFFTKTDKMTLSKKRRKVRDQILTKPPLPE